MKINLIALGEFVVSAIKLVQIWPNWFEAQLKMSNKQNRRNHIIEITTPQFQANLKWTSNQNLLQIRSEFAIRGNQIMKSRRSATCN